MDRSVLALSLTACAAAAALVYLKTQRKVSGNPGNAHSESSEGEARTAIAEGKAEVAPDDASPLPTSDPSEQAPPDGDSFGALSDALGDCECGFGRPMNENLVDSAGQYNRHVFVATGHGAWPANVTGPVNPELLERYNRGNEAKVTEDAANAAQRTLAAISKGIKGAKGPFKEAGHSVKVNASNELSKLKDVVGSVDVVIFPDNLRIVGVTEENVPALMEALLLPAGELAPGVHGGLTIEAASTRYLFVCAHTARDSRCGMCGPALVDQFQREIDQMQQQRQVSVFKCSHVGGHVYAGNVLSFPSGNWFGYVTPEAVPAILGATLAQPQTTNETSFETYELNIRKLWRGQMGVDGPTTKALVEGWKEGGVLW